MSDDKFSIDLATEAGRLDYAQQLWRRYCEDLQHDPAKAHTRLIAGTQIALREAAEGRKIEPLIYFKAA
jgi:hypothetical protein